MNISDKAFITIQGWMRTELQLTGTTLLVYAIIYGFSQDGESEFFGSQKYMAEWCGCSDRTIRSSLDWLLQHGYIKATKKEQGQTVHYVTVSRVGNIFRGGSEKSSEGSEISSDDNITNNITNIKSLSKDKGNISETTETNLSEYESKMYSEDVRKKRKIEKAADAPKKLSLWDKCVQHIEEYTDNDELRTALKEYLRVRLAIKDKPLFAPQFKSIVNKLSTLSGDPVRIVQRATQGAWLTFYDEKPNGGGYSNRPKYEVFSENENISSKKVSKEEYEEIMKYGQKF